MLFKANTLVTKALYNNANIAPQNITIPKLKAGSQLAKHNATPINTVGT